MHLKYLPLPAVLCTECFLQPGLWEHRKMLPTGKRIILQLWTECALQPLLDDYNRRHEGHQLSPFQALIWLKQVIIGLQDVRGWDICSSVVDPGWESNMITARQCCPLWGINIYRRTVTGFDLREWWVWFHFHTHTHTKKTWLPLIIRIFRMANKHI